jgi:hypothetical protein
MGRIGLCCLGLLLVVVPARADEPAGRPVQDLWDAAYINGVRTGYVHTSVREIERDGSRLLHTKIVFDMTLKRFEDVIRMHSESGTDETPDGKVVGVFLSNRQGKKQTMVVTGTVRGDQLHLHVAGDNSFDRSIPWNDQVIGLYRELYLFRDKKVKPGDQFKMLHFEPNINGVVSVQVAVKGLEEVEIDKMRRRLLRAEAVPDKIDGVQLPKTIYWLDEERQVIRAEAEVPGTGKLVTIRTTKEQALQGVSAATVGDIGISQLLPLNRRLVDAHDTSLVVYRITLPGEDDPAAVLAQDERQTVKNVQGKTLELHIKAVRQPPAQTPEGAKVGDEYLESNYFINCADAKVKELAQKAVSDETDPWKKAQKIEHWVKTNMKMQDFTEAMATADHVARTLEGDCTEHAMLAAAMCRAVGVPSRTAIGLVYVDLRKAPVLGYHMWTEVWVRGRWMDIDATLGRGSIGAAHIKITDASWHDTQSLRPLFPVMRFMGTRPEIQVMRVAAE